MSSLKRFHGSMNSLFSVSSNSSVKSKSGKSNKDKTEDSSVFPYKLLDRSASPKVDTSDTEGKIQSVAFRLLYALRNKKEAAVRKEVASTLESYGRPFLSNLLGYVAELDQHELSKRGLNLMEACGKLIKLVAENLVNVFFSEPPHLVSVPEAVPTETKFLFLAGNLEGDEDQHPSKRRKVEVMRKPSNLRQHSSWRSKRQQILAFLRKNKKLFKNEFSAQQNGALSTSLILKMLLCNSTSYFIVQPTVIHSSSVNINEGLNNLSALLLWHSISKHKHRDFLIDSELKMAVEGNGTEHLHTLLWHVVQLNDSEITKEGYSIDYVRGAVALFLVRQMRLTRKSAKLESEEESPQEPKVYFRIPHLKRACGADCTQRNTPVIPFDSY